MRTIAAGGLIAACVYVGLTYPVLALTTLLVFAALGTTYELIRTKK